MTGDSYKKGIVLFAHGSRDPKWAKPFIRLESRLVGAIPGAIVKVAFLQDCTPRLHDVAGDMARAGVSLITVIPMFLSVGAHSSGDFPVMVAKLNKAYPEILFEWTAVLGHWEKMEDAICKVITDCFGQSSYS